MYILAFAEVKKSGGFGGLKSSCARRIGVFALLIFGTLSSVAAQSVASIVSGSSRSDNQYILSILTGPSLTDATAAAKALGQRNDPYVGDILDGLFSRISGAEAGKYGLLFREVLDYVFLLPQPAPTKIRANSAELARLLKQLQSIGDGATKRALLEASVYLPAGDSGKALLDEGAFLAGYLRRTQGRFSPDRLDESLGYLEACRAHSNEVLRAQVVSLVELSRDAVFVRAARSYLSTLK